MENRPLLFIKAPPAFFKEIVESVPEKHDEEPSKELSEAIPVREDIELRKRKERLLFLSNPFQQKAYQPLLFNLHDGRKITGVVQEVNIETDEVMIKTSNNVVHPISIKKLDDLLWRGKSFF